MQSARIKITNTTNLIKTMDSRKSFKPEELAHRFGSKYDFVRYFKESLQ